MHMYEILKNGIIFLACLVAQSHRIFATLWTIACQASHLQNFSGKHTGVGCHFLLQRIFPTQGSNPHLLCLLHCQVGSLPLVPPGKHIYKYAFICPLFFGFPSHLGHYTALSRVSCAVQQGLISYLFIHSIISIMYICQSQSPHSFHSP